MTQKKFWSDLVFVQGVNLLIKTSWILVIDRAVQDLLPAEEYGTYYRLLSLSILFVIILDMGLNSLNTREVAQNENYFKANLKKFLGAKTILALFYLVALFLASIFLKLSNNQLILLGSLAGFQIVNSFNQYFRSNISAMHLFKLDGLLAVADRLFVIIVCGSWLIFPSLSHNLTIRNFVLIQLGGVVLTAIIASIINWNKWRALSPSQDQQIRILQLIKTSLPFALLITLMAIFTRVDAVMIGQILGDGETDRYAMGYRLIDAANMMAALFSGMLLPMFSRLIDDRKEIGKLSGVASKVLLLPALLGSLILAPYASDLLSFMYPNKASIVAPQTFIFLLFSFIASGSVFIFGTLLTAAKRLKTLNTMACIAAISNIVLNYFLIPKYGIRGAAFATLLTQSLFAFGCFIDSYKFFSFQISSVEALKITAAISAFIFLFYGSKQFFTSTPVHISFGVALSVLLVVGSGIISLNTLKNLSRRKTHNPSDN